MKDTKKRLLSSIATLCVCFAMLIGSTYAWFTDSASTGVNKIQAGNLDVQLLMYDGSNYVDISDNTEAIFGTGSIAQNNNAESLWEPGKTQVAYLAIKNNGNLALKYKVALDVDNVSKNLYEVMEYAITPDATNTNHVTAWTSGNSVVEGTQTVSTDVSLPVETTHYFALSVHMKEAAGNEYKDGEVNFDLTVLATQDTVENDSYDNTYDENAEYPIVANTQAELNAAITSAQNGSAISTEVVLPAGDFKLENGTAQNKNITISGTADTVVTVVGDTGNQMNYQNGATLAFEGVTIQGQTAGDFGGIAHVAKTTFVNCTFNGKLTLYGDATFINCTFTNKSDYAIWTWGAKNAEFIGCTFDSGGKALLLYGGAGSTETPTTNLTVTDCEFNDDNTLTTADKAAIEIGNDYDAVYNLTVKNIIVNGFAINPEGISTGSTIWANKKSMDRTHLNVVIDGVDVY